MTIAAGFRFNQGILVCADTQFSGASVKFQSSKLTHVLSGGKKDIVAVYAMSGRDGYMQTAVSACEEALFKIKESRHLDQFAIKEELSKALAKVYKRHFYPHKLYGQYYGPQASLIIGAWTSDEDPMIFWTVETTVNIIDDYKCIGSGAEIATHALLPLVRKYADERTLKETILLATHALKMAKDSNPDCGGKSNFAAIRLGGVGSDVTEFQIDAAEAYSYTFNQILSDLFLAGAEDEAGAIEVAIRALRGHTEKIDEEQKSAREARKILLNSLEKC